MSSTVRPASSTAARIASSGELEARAVELATDRGLPDTGDDGAPFEAVVGHRLSASTATKLGMAKPPGPGSKPDVDLHVDGRVFRRAPAQPADDAEAGMIGELDEDDRVRHLEVGHPPLVVDGEAVDAGRGW